MTERSKPILTCCLVRLLGSFQLDTRTDFWVCPSMLQRCFSNSSIAESLAAAPAAGPHACRSLSPAGVYVKVTLGTVSISGW